MSTGFHGIEEGICERCGEFRELFKFDYIEDDQESDDFGKMKTIMICWDCDFEIINGWGEIHEDIGDIIRDRIEERAGEF